jgi:membrane carboxypeptidase/penicillin-binding protein
VLRQIPDVSGGMTVMDPKTGRVFAMVGGWDFQQSQFNRVTQAKRQPGSAFKPFVFVTALQNGFTPDSVVDDAPISIPQGPGLPPWSPSNYEGTFAGPSTLRDALIHSRNLVTARLATMVGLPAIAQTVERFDIMDRMPLYYSMALGAGETTLLRLTTAYAMLDNNGRWLLPSVIDSVQDRNGRIIYQKGVGGCSACFVVAGPRTTPDNNPLYRASGTPDGSVLPIPNAQYGASPLIYKPTKADPLVDQTANANVVSMMQGVVERGTGIAVAAVGKPIAGKTGTTSDWNDAWFVGFSPGLAAGVYVGFDQPRTLGDGETGGHVAAPIFRDFMMEALKNAPATPFNQAPGVQAPSDGDKIASANPPDKNTGEKSEKWAQKKLAKQLAAAAQDPAGTDTFGSSGDDPAAARNPDDPAPAAAPAVRPRSRAALDRMGPADREFLARAFPDMAPGTAAAVPPSYAPPNYAPPGYSAPSYTPPSYPASSYAAAAAPPAYGARGAGTAAYAPAPGYGAYGGGAPAPAYSAPPGYGAPPAYSGGYASAPAGYGGGSSGYVGYGDAAPRYARDPAPQPRYYPPARVTGGLY